MKVEFYKHSLDETDIERAAGVMRSLMLTTGAVTAEFERDFAAHLGAHAAVAVTSCTAALHLALLARGIGPGDEVVTTPMSFAATSHAILHAGAIPVFADVEPATGNLDPDRVAEAVGPRTRAILPVHLYGTMCDMRKLRAIADRHGAAVIEDCAHAIEAERDGLRPGAAGDLGCFSFYATKNLTCGEGGAVTTGREEDVARLRRLRQHGMTKGAADRHGRSYEHYDIVEDGWKYNMDNIHAAILLGQLPRLDALWPRREQIARRYEEAFGRAGIAFPRVPAGAKPARHLFTIQVDRRDEVLAALQARGIGVAVNYRPIHLMTYYRERFGFREGMFPVAERIGARTVTLPLYPKLTDEEVEHVIAGVLEVVQG